MACTKGVRNIKCWLNLMLPAILYRAKRESMISGYATEMAWQQTRINNAARAQPLIPNGYLMIKLVRLLAVTLGLSMVADCSHIDSDKTSSALNLTGDENGGKIPRVVGEANAQSSAYEILSTHCAKFGKKGFITQMDFESGTLSFQCVRQKR